MYLTTTGGSANSRVGVGGDSAGGSLAANVPHYLTGLDFQVKWPPDKPNTDACLTPNALKYFYITNGDQGIFFNLKSS